MPREKVNQDQLRAILLAEAEKSGLEDMPQNLTFYGTEEGSAGSWTVSFDGPLMFSPDARKFAGIIMRLSAEFDIEWQTRH